MYDNFIMKLTPALLLFAAAASPLAAQTTTPKPAVARPAGTAARPASAAASACAKLPTLSDKIPALPATAPCAKHLYTITTQPAVKLEYVSPMEGPGLKDDLGIDSTTFSLDYIDTKIGTGELAGAHSWYTINYTGYLPDGTKFDSSIDRGKPITIPYGQHQVIAGWDTGFAGMRVGGRRRLIIPFQLGYGTQGKAPIPPKSMLIFDVELVSISEAPPKPDTPPTPPAPPAGAAPASQKTPTAAPATPPAAPPTADPTKPAAVPPASTTPKL
jgi:peptidylprolyl isomerase